MAQSSVTDIDVPDETALTTEDDTPVDNVFSEKQQRLLAGALFTSWHGPPTPPGSPARPFVAMANVGLFHVPRDPAVVPDMLLAVDVEQPDDPFPKKNRSYFVWRYGKPPDVVVEVVSNRKGHELDDKLRLYERIRVTYYVVYDPERLLGSEPLHVFELRAGAFEQREHARFEPLGLELVLWDGEYEQLPGTWLRWCALDGQLIHTGAEQRQCAEDERQRAEDERQRAEDQRQRADHERQRAEDARQRAEALAQKLRELGVDPDDVG